MEKTKIKQEEVKLFLSSLPEQTYENLDPVLIDQNIDSRQQAAGSRVVHLATLARTCPDCQATRSPD